jgi:hypothetical protein
LELRVYLGFSKLIILMPLKTVSLCRAGVERARVLQLLGVPASAQCGQVSLNLFQTSRSLSMSQRHGKLSSLNFQIHGDG